MPISTNPTKIGSFPGLGLNVIPYGYTVVATSGIQQSIYLQGQQSYTLAHNSVDETGASETDTIFIAISGNCITNWNSGTDKLLLTNGHSIVIGPGISNINYQTAITATGSPTFTILPGNREHDW